MCSAPLWALADRAAQARRAAHHALVDQLREELQHGHVVGEELNGCLLRQCWRRLARTPSAAQPVLHVVQRAIGVQVEAHTGEMLTAG